MDIVKRIKEKQKFLITTHVSPDGDAICSELAIGYFLEQLGKEVIIVNDHIVPDHYKFLKGIEKIKTFDEYQQEPFDAVVIVDCPTLERIGRVKELLRDHYVINIDHHISNEDFADISLVDADASSSGEVIYTMYKQMGIPLNKDIAMCLYIAILTDTGNFNYSNTNAKTHLIVAELLGYGVEPYDISVKVYASKRMCDIRLLGMVLETLDVVSEGQIAYMVCTKEMIEKSGSDISATENFVNYARGVKSATVGMFIRQNTQDLNAYKVSIRTKEEISATSIAGVFGGGGHVHAAGCTIKGKIEDVKQKLFDAVVKELEKSK